MSRRSKGRNRRSKSEQSKRMRNILIRILLILCGLFAVVLLAWNWTLAWLQGDSFRSRLETRMGESTGAEIRIQDNLVIDGNRVSESRITIENMGTVDSVGMERLSMEIERTELLSRRLHINKLTMEEGRLAVHLPFDLGMQEKEREEDIPFYLPKEVQLDMLECKNSDIICTTESGQEYALMGASLTATPMAGNAKKWQLTIQDSHLSTPYNFLRSCNLKQANIIYNGKTINVTESRFMLAPGEIRLQALYSREKKHWKVDMAVNKADVQRLLPADWKKKLSGELFGKLILSGDANGLLKGSGSVSVQQAVLEGLPFLSELKLDNTYPYRSVQIEKANCRISYPYADKNLNIENAWLFDNIDVRTKGGLLRVTGHVLIGKNGELGGTVTVGVPQGVLQGFAAFGPVVQQIFNGKGEAGYAWVNINLSGTLDAPQEDLSVRLATLMSGALSQSATDVAKKGIETASGIFSDLLNQVGGNTDTPSQDSDSSPDKASSPASDIIQSGLDMLF